MLLCFVYSINLLFNGVHRPRSGCGQRQNGLSTKRVHPPRRSTSELACHMLFCHDKVAILVFDSFLSRMFFLLTVSFILCKKSLNKY